ncbi:nucleotide-diphospho-sugar transferase [Dipodascopsis uninucleata]
MEPSEKTSQPCREVYCTLLLTDSYLPGAITLAKALRDYESKRKLAILVVTEWLSKHTMHAVNSYYDHVIPVPPIVTPSMTNLHSLGRPDLYASLTKILLWNQTQFDKIVYLDADVLPVSNLDDLFDVDSRIAASPDSGWPDIFNSGVIVLKPSHTDFLGLYSLYEKVDSFDGGDQGLLNTYFGDDWLRLSFLYNVTQTSGYQYLPALNYFRSRLRAIHFIGRPKPWQQDEPPQLTDIAVPEFYGATVAHTYEQFVSKWWKTYKSTFPEIIEPATSDSGISTAADDHYDDVIHGSDAEQPALTHSAVLDTEQNAQQNERNEQQNEQPFSFIHLSGWMNPAVSEPPQHTSGEAMMLPDVSYSNVWDQPYNRNTDVVFVPPQHTVPEFVIQEYDVSITSNDSIPEDIPGNCGDQTPCHADSTHLYNIVSGHSEYQESTYVPDHPRTPSPSLPPLQISASTLDTSGDQVEERVSTETFGIESIDHSEISSPTPITPIVANTSQFHGAFERTDDQGQSTTISEHSKEPILPRQPSPPPPPIFPWELRDVPPPVRVFPEDIRYQNAQASEALKDEGNSVISNVESEVIPKLSTSGSIEDEEKSDLTNAEKTIVNSINTGETSIEPKEAVAAEKNEYEDDQNDYSSSIETQERDSVGAEEPMELKEIEYDQLEAYEFDVDDGESISEDNQIKVHKQHSIEMRIEDAKSSRPRRQQQITPAYNAWDRDPVIVEYAYRVSSAFSGGTGVLFGDRAMNFTYSPTGIGRRSFMKSSEDNESENSYEMDDDDEIEWDPLKKLEELANLPALLLSRNADLTQTQSDNSLEEDRVISG